MTYLTRLPLLALLALATPVWAQTVPAEGETAAEQPAATDLAMGEEVDGGAPQVGDTYLAEVVGDWEMRCVKVEEGAEPCQMYQLMKNDEGSPVAEITLFRLAGGGQAKAGAMVGVPLETLLTAQLTIAVDGGKGKRYPFSFCNTVGCFARIGLTDSDVGAFKKGNAATVTIVPAAVPDQQVTVKMSLKGFTSAYDKVSEAPAGN